ncbi:MAG: hypothetical protein AVDCRST_MAG76-3732 [uncultured Acidimicrobiales bacterium]|uniref:Histidine kinase/HSP90-like ATPase domain-containing protein n=1 Tax=uncultured Acidimicrobiales bacterium TaxID=310071 RepID=A0A6J4JEP3_9ACTN|nr:MAG: hypothetical protein AVDCRST_MAG76-3732 [uncultured Acidimicrobiales bacterium]
MTAPALERHRASLDGELGDVAAVRRSIGEWLRGWGLEPLVEDVELVASELTTNAILHAGGAVDVVVERRAGGVRVEVHDGRPDVVPTAPAPLGVGGDDENEDEMDRMARALFERTTTGRGLLLVQAFSDAWGVDVNPAAKGVWAEVGTGRLPRGSATAPAGFPPAGGVRVQLCGVPVRLVLYSAANLDELVRELQTTDFDAAAPTELAELGERLARETAASREPLRAAAREALQSRHRAIDIELVVPPAQVSILRHFVDLTGQVEHLCRAGVLLSQPPTAEVTAFRRWFVDEVARQVAGRPMTPCSFPV